MFADHLGYVIFPEYEIFRYIGRIAMPIFAFYIGEGCLHTRCRRRYFSKLLSLAVFCQTVYIAFLWTSNDFDEIHLNILFTFALSMPLCFCLSDIKKQILEKEYVKAVCLLAKFILRFLFSIAFCILKFLPISPKITVDYGIAGVLLPLFALTFSRRVPRFFCFGFGLVMYNFLLCHQMPYIWFSLFALIPLCFYNGKRGTAKLKNLFYFFYPLHILMIFAVDLIFFS